SDTKQCRQTDAEVANQAQRSFLETPPELLPHRREAPGHTRLRWIGWAAAGRTRGAQVPLVGAGPGVEFHLRQAPVARSPGSRCQLVASARPCTMNRIGR